MDMVELLGRYRHEVRLTPALLPLAGCLCGAVPQVMLLGWEQSAGVWCGLVVLALALAAAWRCVSRALLLLTCVLYGWGAWYGRWEARGQGVRYLRQLPSGDCHAELEVEVRGCPGAPGERPLRQECEVTRVCREGVWMESSGGVQVMFGAGVGILHGERWRVRGPLTVPSEDGYGRHLRSLGLWRQLEALEAERVSPATGWRLWLQRYQGLRERLSGRLASGMSAEYGGLYQSMMLGRRDLFPRHSREMFMRSGMLHVFAISGLHVGLVYLVVRWLLSRLSWLMGVGGAVVCSCGVALAYVVLTGLTPSSGRALLMLAAPALAELRHRGVNIRQAFCLAALLEVMCCPLYLQHVGFLFSFLSVAVLIYGQRSLSALVEVVLERRRWVPGHLRHGVWESLLERGLEMVLMLALAWLGSVALTLWMNGVLPLGGLVSAPLAQVSATVLVMGALPKLALSWLWPACGEGLGGVLELLMRLLVASAEWGGGEGRHLLLLAPSGGMAALFVATLLLLLTFGWRMRLARPVLSLWLLSWLATYGLEVGERRPSLLVAQGADGGRPAVAVLDKRRGRCDVVSCGSRRSALALSDELSRLGLGRVDSLTLEEGHEPMAGARALLRQRPVAAVVYAGGRTPGVSPPQRRLGERLAFAGGAQRRWREPGSIRVVRLPTGAHRVYGRLDDGTPCSLLLPPRNGSHIWHLHPP